MFERISGLGSDPSAALGELKEKALELEATAREQLSTSADTARRYIIEHPAKALALALGIGVVLGWLIKRR
jgi:ElaB/YqjD/DUF883 family membrane-anchored ribosome-binding protein